LSLKPNHHIEIELVKIFLLILRWRCQNTHLQGQQIKFPVE